MKLTREPISEIEPWKNYIPIQHYEYNGKHVLLAVDTNLNLKRRKMWLDIFELETGFGGRILGLVKNSYFPVGGMWSMNDIQSGAIDDTIIKTIAWL